MVVGYFGNNAGKARLSHARIRETVPEVLSESEQRPNLVFREFLDTRNKSGTPVNS